MSDLQPLFWPRSIVLVGASPDRSIIRGRIVEAVRRYDFDGPVYAISRTHDRIDGLHMAPSIDALPEPVDLAIITIPAPMVPEALEACGRKGIRSANTTFR